MLKLSPPKRFDACRLDSLQQLMDARTKICDMHVKAWQKAGTRYVGRPLEFDRDISETFRLLLSRVAHSMHFCGKLRHFSEWGRLQLTNTLKQRLDEELVRTFMHDDIGAASLMILLGANVNHRGPYLLNFGQIVVSKGNLENVSLVLEAGFDPNVLTESGINAGFIACGVNPDFPSSIGRVDYDVLRLLLSNGWNVHSTNSGGDTIPHLAARVGDAKLLKFFVANGFRINCADGNGLTVGHIAARGGHLEFLKSLLEFGLNPNVRDMFHCTPGHYAESAGHLDCFKILVEHGLKLDKELEEYAKANGVQLNEGWIGRVTGWLQGMRARFRPKPDKTEGEG